MRILRVTTTGIGGVPDGTLGLPDLPVTALAGPNGTGKTKLLACMLSPWSNTLPSTQDEAAEVAIELHVTCDEQQSLNDLSQEAGWGHASVPDTFVLKQTSSPNVGVRRSSEPNYSVLRNFASQQLFLQNNNSLNIIYLPAERRLKPSGQQGIDLNQLSDALAWQKTAEPRNAIRNYGQLDDQEFEQYAKALCVAASLPDEEGTSAGADLARTQWDDFKATVDSLIAPKYLIPLTRQRPDQLRVGTPDGHTHPVPELSSGERQALVIISRVMRAGTGHTVVLIDEPDAFLHPHLSQRLMEALERGVGDSGQLIVATHSPAILDSLPPTAIIRLQHGEVPRLVADEAERVDLYRSAGFRASALTQADLLLVVEGDSDDALLSLFFPELTRAAVRSAGSRARVFREVEQLSPYELPVLGVVDADVLADPAPDVIRDAVTVWPTADIEGVMLSSDDVIQKMLDLGLLKASFRTVADVRTVLDSLVDEQRDNVVAEIAQRKLRDLSSLEWPSPRGDNPIERLRSTVGSMGLPTESQVDAIIAEAEALWDEHADNRWRVVRGKRVLSPFAASVSEMRSGRALLEAVARARPTAAGLEPFATKLQQGLASHTS